MCDFQCAVNQGDQEYFVFTPNTVKTNERHNLPPQTRLLATRKNKTSISIGHKLPRIYKYY